MSGSLSLYSKWAEVDGFSPLLHVVFVSLSLSGTGYLPVGYVSEWQRLPNRLECCSEAPQGKDCQMERSNTTF